MNHSSASPNGIFTNPIAGVALGDPFVMRHRGRFYLYGTNDGPPLPDGRVVPVYRSDDLLHWEALGGALVPEEPGSDHWAPEVLAWNGRFYMVVSFGDVHQRGHALWVAVADRPEGPFRLKAQVSDPSERFSIDGSWLLDDDGQLYLFRCLDFVDPDNPPHGTGIVVQRMTDPLTPAGPPVPVLRAHSPWHLFEVNREMTLYENRRFSEWTTIEGPAPIRRLGRYFCGYSGGNYAGNYGTGEAVASSPLGPYQDLRGREGPIFATTPGLVEGPGHFSVVQPDLVHSWIVLHGRTPGDSVRRVWLCPASWDAKGIAIGPLTDQPQPAPPLPTEIHRLALDGPKGWHRESGQWTHVPDGLEFGGPGQGLCWREGPDLTGDWAVELYFRFSGTGGGGILLRGDVDLEISLPAVPGGQVIIHGANGRQITASLPTLGQEAFDFQAFHAITIEATSGLAEIRLDGCVLANSIALPKTPARFGLRAFGPIIFDAVSVTLLDR